jgi:hypothetical protein
MKGHSMREITSNIVIENKEKVALKVEKIKGI